MLKNIVMLAVVVLALGAAAWYTLRKRAENVIPDDPSVTTHWMCEKCGWATDLTDRKLEEWRQTPNKMSREAALGKQMVFQCPQCNTYTVVTGVKCKRHNIWFCAISSRGQLLGCPQCAKEKPQ